MTRKSVKKRGTSNATKVTTKSKFESKHHRDVAKAAVKVDFHAGLLTRGQICDKYGIWRSTLSKYENSGDWEYASKREAALAHMHTRMIQKYSESRATYSDQHLEELNSLKDKVLNSKSKDDLELWVSKAEAVMKIIRSERIALAMPNEYKYIEQRNENVYRVEDALKELDLQMGKPKEVIIDGEFTHTETNTPISPADMVPNSDDV